MKTYEPLPLLEYIKDYRNTLPSTPQKSIDMIDEDIEPDQTSLLEEFKTNSPTKTYLNDLQIKTVSLEYNKVDNTSEDRNDDVGKTSNNTISNINIPNNNICAKNNIVIKTSFPIVSTTKNIIGNESSQYVNNTSKIYETNCHRQESYSDINELVNKRADIPNNIGNQIESNDDTNVLEIHDDSIIPVGNNKETGDHRQESYCDINKLVNDNRSVIPKNIENKIISEDDANVLEIHNDSISVINTLDSHNQNEDSIQNISKHNIMDRRYTEPSINGLSNIETLSPYIRTNEFINEILKSPVRHEISESNMILYEEECTDFKDINLNSPMKPILEEQNNEVYNDPHLIHLRTLEEIDEDEALCLCSNSVSSTLSSTTKRLPCLSDSADIDSGTESASSSWDRTVAEVKGHAITRLQDELRKAHEELKLKDEEVTRLSRIRQEVESELEELTASLFQEAHNMVREANMRQATSEKLLRESKLQVDVLSAEVNALKTLVLTSTPSRPNPHLHPQIENKNKEDIHGVGSAGGIFRKHRRSPSHCNLKYGREDSPPSESAEESETNWTFSQEVAETKDCKEVDPVVHKEFLEWRKTPSLSKDNAFISRIYEEDIDKSLDFTNTTLTQEVREAINSGDIFIEAVSDKSKCSFPKKCALLEVPRLCQYRMKLGNSDQYYYISKLCRNRIIKVCDFVNYLHYIERGLVKSSAHDMYWEINRLRKEIMLARLGLTKDDD